jgi:hypothetical protein
LTEQRVRVIVEETADPARAEPHATRRKVETLSNMARVEVEIPIRSVSIARDGTWQVRRMEHDARGVTTELLTQADRMTLSRV